MKTEIKKSITTIKGEGIHSALRRIGLALNMSHNLIVTDDPSAKTDETHWETDHSQEIKDLECIENILISKDIYHGCNCCNTTL